MFCPNCGTQIDDNARFCPECGTKTGKADIGAAVLPSAPPVRQPAQEPPMQGQRVTENIYLCPDGVYRWAYEYKLMRDPTILITIFKVVVLSVGICIALMLIINFLNARLYHNQIYAGAADFDFVQNYINERLPAEAIRK